MRVHRHGRLQFVAEVHDHGVADFGFDHRPGDAGGRQRVPEVGAVGPVAVGVEGGLPVLDWRRHHLVAVGGDDVPGSLLGRDPVFARRAGADQGGEIRADGLAAAGVGGLHPRRHLDLAGQRADVDLPLVGRHLLPGQGAEKRHAAEAEEAPTVNRIEAQREPYFFTVTVNFISVGWIVQMNL